jgi:hypothetical protein
MMEMKRHRQVLAVAFCWFLLLAVVVPAGVAPFVYEYVLAWALLFLLSPKVGGFPLWRVGGTASAIYIAAAALEGWPTDFSLLLTVAMIFVSLLIAKALRDSDAAFERTLRFRVNVAQSEPRSFGSIHNNLQIELQRGRTHQRPLSVLAISASNLGENEVGYLASLLSDEMRAFDILGAHGDHFVTMLPETDPEKAMQFITRLRTATRTKLGLELNIGLSSFPTQLTLGALLERAKSDMKAADPPSVDGVLRSVQSDSSWSA